MNTLMDTGTHKIESEGVATIPSPKYTPLEFLRMFTMTERKALKDSTDDVVVDFLWLADKASYVSLQDADTIAAINYFVTIGIITAERAAEILG